MIVPTGRASIGLGRGGGGGGGGSLFSKKFGTVSKPIEMTFCHFSIQILVLFFYFLRYNTTFYDIYKF